MVAERKIRKMVYVNTKPDGITKRKSVSFVNPNTDNDEDRDNESLRDIYILE